MKNKRVILLAKESIRDELSEFCNNWRSPEGFKINMGDFTDVAIKDKLEIVKRTWTNTKVRTNTIKRPLKEKLQ